MKTILTLLAFGVACGFLGYLIGRKSGVVIGETSAGVLAEAKEYKGYADQYYYVYQYLPPDVSERMRKRIQSQYITARNLYESLPNDAPLWKAIDSYFKRYGSLDWQKIDERLPEMVFE